jgi:hypothetical protein
MNRPLPRNAHGIKATFLLNKSGPYGTPTTKSRRPPCFSTQIGAGDNPQVASELVDPHEGQMVTVTCAFPAWMPPMSPSAEAGRYLEGPA